MTSQTTQLPTVLAALAVVLGLIWLCARLARARGFGLPGTRGNQATSLVLEDTLMLDRARRLYLVRCAGRELVLLTGGGQDQLLALAPAPTASAVTRAGDAP